MRLSFALIGIGAGLASALLLYSAGHGSVSLMFAFIPITPRV